MIITFFIWLYIIILGYLYGSFSLNLYKKTVDEKKVPNSSTVTIFLGIAVITTLATYLSLIIKLGLVANLLFFFGAIAILVSEKYKLPKFVFRWRWKEILIGGIILLAFLSTLESVTHVPENSDTSLYHAQTIHWIEEYRVVPGLGNLQGRLAFNSSWLLLNALFSFSFLGHYSFHTLSGLFVFLAILFFAETAYKLLEKEINLVNLSGTLFIPLSFYVIGGEIKSPGTDLPAIILFWILFILVIKFAEFSESNKTLYFIITFLAVFAITIKLSLLPALLLVTYLVFIQRKRKQANWKTLNVFLTISIFVLLPWLIRNIILSGYLIFPFAEIDIFSFDWKIPLSRVEGASKGILGFARLSNADWQKAIDMSFREWFPLWYRNHTRNQQLVFLLAIFSPLGILLQSFMQSSLRFDSPRNSTRKNHPYNFMFFGVIYAGLIFWIFKAPSFRFGYSFLIPTVFLAYLPILIKLFDTLNVKKHFAIIILLVVSILAYQIYIFIRSLETKTINERILFPLDYSPSRADLCPLEDLEIFCARDHNQCSYESFPCVPSLPFNIASRKGTLQGGFFHLP